MWPSVVAVVVPAALAMWLWREQSKQHWVIGTWTDEMDVEYLDLYALNKPTR